MEVLITYRLMNKQTPPVILVYSPFACIRALVSYAVGTPERAVLSIDHITRAQELLRLGGIELAILDTEGLSESSLVEATKDDSVSIVLLDGRSGLKRPNHAVKLSKPFSMDNLFTAMTTALFLRQYGYNRTQHA